MSAQLERLPAIVLMRTNYGESDRIIQAITPRGMRSAIAKGVRRSRSKLAGGIEPLAVNELILRRGKGQLLVVGSARMEVSFRRILQDYDRLQFAYEALGLVRRGAGLVDEPDWYEISRQLLAGLDEGAQLAVAKAWFYLRYAGLMGYELSAWRDVNGQALVAEQRYRYDAYERGLMASPRGSLAQEHIKIMRLLQQHPLRAASQVRGLGPHIAEVLATAQRHVQGLGG